MEVWDGREVVSEGNLVGKEAEVEKKKDQNQGGRLPGMGEGRERQACSKAERQRGSWMVATTVKKCGGDRAGDDVREG